MNSQKKISLGICTAGENELFGPVISCVVAFEYPLPEILPEKLALLTHEELFSFCTAKVFSEIDPIDVSKHGKEWAKQESITKAFQKMSDHINFDAVHVAFASEKFETHSVPLQKNPIVLQNQVQTKLELLVADRYAQYRRKKSLEAFLESGTAPFVEYPKKKNELTSFHRFDNEYIQSVHEQKPKMLLHVCCGPDACVPFLDYKDQYSIIAFWYDPNIQPKEEYDKRLEAFKKVCEIEGIEYIEGEYDVDRFFETIQGLESTPEQGAKCMKCYDMRLVRSVEEAKKQNCDIWTTTLLTSPHKVAEKLCQMGKFLEAKENAPFLDVHFRKNNGFNRSVEYTKQHGIYRQNYCGCVYSMRTESGAKSWEI